MDNMTSRTRPTGSALNYRAVDRQPIRTAYITNWCLSVLFTAPKSPTSLSTLLRPN